MLGIMVLGFGLSISISMFTLVKGTIWALPGVENSEQMMYLRWGNDKQLSFFLHRLNSIEYNWINQKAKSFQTVFGTISQIVALYNPDSEAFAKRYEAVQVSESFFQAIGVNAILGRVLGKQDMLPNGAHAVVISYAVWQEQFGGLRDAIGRTVLINGVSHSVVGVMPPGFHFPWNKELWLGWRNSHVDEKPHNIRTVGVLKDGVSQDQVDTEMQELSISLRKKYLFSYKDRTQLVAEPYNHSFIKPKLRSVLQILSLVAMLVFIITCANVSNLILVRVSKRQHELAIRQVVGASRLQIIRQVLLEGLFFSVGGLVVGLLINMLGARFIWFVFQQSYGNTPYWWSMRLDWDVYLFAIAIMFASIVTSSVLPAIRATMKSSGVLIKEAANTLSGQFIGNIAKIFVAVQVMCVTTLTIISLLMVLLFHYFTDWQLSFDAKNTLAARLQLNSTAGFPSIESIGRFYDEVATDLKSLPAVKDVAFAFQSGGEVGMPRKFEIKGRYATKSLYQANVSANIVSPGYFSVFAMRPISGRLLLETDDDSSDKVVVVNQHFVDAFFNGSNPLGKSIRVYRPGGRRGNPIYSSQWTNWMRVVGVVNNAQRKLLPGESSVNHAEVYIPIQQRRVRSFWLLVNVHGQAGDWVKSTSQIIQDHAPLLAPKRLYPSLQEMYDEKNRLLGTITTVVVCFGIVALVVTIVGLSSLIAFTTLLQQREFGIRVALGATSDEIIALMFRRTALLLASGLVLGFSVATVISGIIKQNMNAMELPVELPSCLLGMSVVLIACILAIAVPVIQALRVSPGDSLRVD